MISGNLKIDTTWSLFLDRDGVINKRIVGGYVTSWSKMEFIPGVPEAIAVLATFFRRIVVVSNQQGVGKGLMSDMDVISIHQGMTDEISRAGGKIDAFYYAPELVSTRSAMRKPGIGMGLKARKEFPEISFKRSVMVGDSLSDMIFGKRLGMTTVHIAQDLAISRQYPAFIDLCFSDLPAFALYLQQIS
jgi:histidinol-phosphate phosphatase family protein